MISKIKNRLIFLALIIGIFAAFAFWFKATYSMNKVSNKSFNSKALSSKVLIATQGSAFKDTIVSTIVSHYKNDPVYIKVLDISSLMSVSVKEYNAIVILHTWEYGSPPKIINEFNEEHTVNKDKIIVFSTSGQGNNGIEGIDALTGASIIENANDYSAKLIERINKLIY